MKTDNNKHRDPSDLTDAECPMDEDMICWDITIGDGLEGLYEDNIEDLEESATTPLDDVENVSEERYRAFNKLITSGRPVHEVLIAILSGKI